MSRTMSTFWSIIVVSLIAYFSVSYAFDLKGITHKVSHAANKVKAIGHHAAAVTSQSDVKVSNKLPFKDRAIWHQRLKWSKDCEDFYNDMGSSYQQKNGAGLAFYKLASNRYVVAVNCGRAAYQNSYSFGYIDLSKTTPQYKMLKLKVFDSGKPRYESMFGGFAEFDKAKKQLKIGSKSSNCLYSTMTYKFNRDGKPILVSQKDDNSCSGKRKVKIYK